MQFSLFFQKHSKIILAALACIIFVLAFRDILLAIVSQWTGEESAGTNHGFLVLLCTGYLLYLKRSQFEKLTPDPQRFGIIPLAFLVILLFLAKLTQIQALQMLVMPLLILCSIYVILGKQYLKLAFVPVAILIFALPIWKPILPLLQDITTWVTEFNLKTLGRPVYVVGNYVYVAGGIFLIEEACSGLRFLLIATILSLVNSDLNSHSMKQGAALLLTAVGLAFLANWIRVIIIVVIGDITNMQNSLVHDHVNFGWVVFLFVVLIPYLLASRYIPQHGFDTERAVPHVVRTAYSPRYFLITMLMIVSVPLLTYGQQFISTNVIEEIELPNALANWSGSNNRLDSRAWKPSFKNASQELFKSYSGSDGAELNLHIFHYSEQNQGAELINVENKIADGQPWSVLPGTEREYVLSQNSHINHVNAVEVMNGLNEKRLVWYWYDIGGYRTSNQYYAKLFQVLAQLQGKNSGNLIAISILCKNECGSRQQYLEDFVLSWSALDS